MEKSLSFIDIDNVAAGFASISEIYANSVAPITANEPVELFLKFSEESSEGNGNIAKRFKTALENELSVDEGESKISVKLTNKHVGYTIYKRVEKEARIKESNSFSPKLERLKEEMECVMISGLKEKIQSGSVVLVQPDDGYGFPIICLVLDYHEKGIRVDIDGSIGVYRYDQIIQVIGTTPETTKLAEKKLIIGDKRK